MLTMLGLGGPLPLLRPSNRGKRLAAAAPISRMAEEANSE